MNRDNEVYVLSDKLNIVEARKEASSFLAVAGIQDPDSNAELLIRHVLGMSSSAYLASLRDPFPEDKKQLWEEVIRRKAAGEPAQYIIGEQEFYGLPLKVTQDVLIPRPETELLVEAIIEVADRLERSAAWFAADIGTGSGAIAAALKHLRPSWHVAASDISPAALAVAQDNVRRLELAVTFKQGNLLEPFAGEAPDIVVSNPPYIPADVIPGLQPEVRDYEPRTALDGGPDGLAPYRRMIAQLPLLRRPPLVIGFELGRGQAEDVQEMLRATGHWQEIMIVPDLAGIDRHVIGIRQE